LAYKVYRGRILNPRGPEEFEELDEGYLAVDAQGKIDSYGPWNDGGWRRFGGAEPVDYGNRIILPGFIDVHLHLPQLDVRGQRLYRSI